MTAVQLFALVMFLRCSEKKDAEETSLDERKVREVNMRRLLASVSLTGLRLSTTVSVIGCCECTDVMTVIQILNAKHPAQSPRNHVSMSRSGHWGRGCIARHIVTKQATRVRVCPDIASHFSQEVGQSGPVNSSHYLIIWARILRPTELQDQISPLSVGELGLNPPYSPGVC